MRPAVKANLANALRTTAKCNDMSLPRLDRTTTFVLDGRSLLNRLQWPRRSTFGGICAMYVNFVQQNYMQSIIEFDGYGNDPSTKDMVIFVGPDVLSEPL